MIVKKIKNSGTDKPKEWQIGDLVDYIRNPSVRNKGEKIEHAGGLNFITRTHVAQKLEMICLARETVHSKMPVNHWVFSWPEGEQPTPRQVDELVKFFLEQMGLQEHQAIYALHNDTKNYHVHIAVNRVHPETCKVVRVNNGFDIRQAQKARALIEKMQGWSPLENAPYVVTEEGEVAKRITPPEPKPTEKAIQFEQATGEKSAQRIAQEKGHKIIKTAKSWEELHEGLKNCGLRFEKKGSGAIIWVGDTAVKASSVDRSFSMGKLVKKLGEFVAGNYEEEVKIGPEPLDKTTVKDLKIYQATTEELDRQRRELGEQNNREKAELLARQKTERREKLRNLLAKYGQAVFYLGAYFLKIQHREEREKFYETLRDRTPSFARPTFRAWLLNRGKVLALPEAREENRHSPPPAEQKTGPQELAFLKYSEAVNAERYRVTVIRMGEDGSRQVFILDKKNGQSMGFTPNELLKRMPELLKLQSRGENIYYTPLSEDRHHILIDDVSPENVVRLQNDGYRPAAIIESSPGNYQCVLTISKFDGEFDRQIANQLTAMLNREYGDPKLSGAIHPHRAPGFENRKPKHKGKNGLYPLVLLRHAVQQICKKALIEARKIEQALAQQLAERKKARPVYPAFTSGDPQQAYFLHYENIRAHLSIEDFSRVDAMIALRMRANGHSPNAVLTAIRECAPTIRTGRDKRRNWPAYAERTMNYAFGFAGDRDLQRNERYLGLWRKIEGISESYQPRNNARLH